MRWWFAIPTAIGLLILAAFAYPAGAWLVDQHEALPGVGLIAIAIGALVLGAVVFGDWLSQDPD